MGLLDKLKTNLGIGRKEVEFDDQIANFVNDEYKRRQSERMPFELQWRLNMEFLRGNQHLDINPNTLSIEEIPISYWHQEREVFNQLATIHETRVAKLSRQKPILKTRPASSDDGDISSAKVSSALLNATWYDQSMNSGYNYFVSWLETCGTTLIKPIWNSNKGRIVHSELMQTDLPERYIDTDKEQNDAEGTALSEQMREMLGGAQRVDIREGDIDTVIVSAFEFFPDSSFADGLESCRSVIHARAYHIDVIEEMWGVRVDPENVDVMSMQAVSSGLGGLGYSTGTFKYSLSKPKHHAVVKEYYERPSRKYPQGRFIVVAGDKTLHVGPMPYMLGDDGEVEFPFVRCTSIHVPGCFWGDTVMRRCIPIQRRYNALRNRKQEYLNRVTIGQWLRPAGSMDEDVELTNAPGEVYEYNPINGGAKPEPIAFPSLPASFENEERTLLQEFTAISGVSELSRYSQAPTGVKSGVALSITNEQDDTRIATTASHIAIAVTQMGKYWIRLYRQFAQEPRILRFVSAEKEVEVMEWTASHLKSDDVIIDNASALGETPSQRRQMIFDLIGTGIFNRPETNPFAPGAQRKIFELLEYGHWEAYADDDEQMHISRARRENMQFKRGQPAMVQDFDDHAVHIAQHNRMRMTSEYEELLKTPAGQMIDAVLQQHIQEHVNAMMQAQMAQMQQQMMMQLPPQQQNQAY